METRRVVTETPLSIRIQSVQVLDDDHRITGECMLCYCIIQRMHMYMRCLCLFDPPYSLMRLASRLCSCVWFLCCMSLWFNNSTHRRVSSRMHSTCVLEWLCLRFIQRNGFSMCDCLSFAGASRRELLTIAFIDPTTSWP